MGSLGAIGLEVARALDAGDLTGPAPGSALYELVAASARDLAAARSRVATLRAPPRLLPLEALAGEAEVVLECAPAACFRTLVEPAVRRGRTVVCVSAGALLESWDLVELAGETGARIELVSGAIVGLDAIQAAAEGGIERVRMVTRKPPSGLAGVAWLEARGVDVGRVTRPTRVFSGNAREGARLFPANVNVAAAVGLAGIGPERTELEIWADPAIERNTHEIEVEGSTARLSLRIENVPAESNPRTGRIVAGSVLAALRKLAGPIGVGT